MVKLNKIPKNAIELTARDLEEYMKIREMWIRNGWFISDDAKDGLFVSIALKDATVLLLFFEEEGKKEEREAIAQLEAASSEVPTSSAVL